MNLLLRIIIFAIGFIIVLIAILMIDKRDSLSTFFVYYSYRDNVNRNCICKND